ncbi:MAG: rRNA pseudouridine synthase [Campylobacteraceae bacterium]|nr:rRNA pseudouridine synthase [Campylobacteraceae bacterium]
MRLNKFISHNTKYSRREADKLISEGKVRVGGKTNTDLSTKVSYDDTVEIDGKKIFKKSEFTVIVYNKPKGELVSKKDDRGRRTIYDTLPKKFAHFNSVGRLDFASEGLLLLTDAAPIAAALMNSDLERVYYLKVKGEISEAAKEAMQNGLELSDASKGAHSHSKIKSMSFAPFLSWQIFGKSGEYTKLKVMINEGKNRELRRFFAHFDAEVAELKRVSYGVMDLGMLKSGKHRFLTNSEYDKLRDFLKENKVYY